MSIKTLLNRNFESSSILNGLHKYIVVLKKSNVSVAKEATKRAIPVHEREMLKGTCNISLIPVYGGVLYRTSCTYPSHNEFNVNQPLHHFTFPVYLQWLADGACSHYSLVLPCTTHTGVYIGRYNHQESNRTQDPGPSACGANCITTTPPHHQILI